MMDVTDTFIQLIAAFPPPSSSTLPKLRQRRQQQTAKPHQPFSLFSKSSAESTLTSEQLHDVHRRTREILHGISKLLSLTTKHGPAYVAAVYDGSDDADTYFTDAAADDAKYMSALQAEPALQNALKSRQSLRALSSGEKQSLDMQVQHMVTTIASYLSTAVEHAEHDIDNTKDTQLHEHLRGLTSLVEHKIAKVRANMRELHRRNGFGKTDVLAITRLDANLPYWQHHQNDFFEDDFGGERGDDADKPHLFAQYRKFHGSAESSSTAAAVQQRVASRIAERKKVGRNINNMSQADAALLQESEAAPPPAAVFTREEIETYENQAQQIFRSVTGMREELSQLSGKVHHVASLQQLFAENVFEQEQTTDLIAEHVDRTSDNITDANVELMSALRKTTSFRYWVTFILLVLSLTLAFLDWYNP